MNGVSEHTVPFMKAAYLMELKTTRGSQDVAARCYRAGGGRGENVGIS